MDPSKRIVTRGPLNVLWDEDGRDINVQPARDVGAVEIQELLRSGRPFPFVVANLGSRLRWIRGDERFDFWKTELQPHLAMPSTGASLEDFPDEYFYFATEWRLEDDDAPFCVLCEMYH